MPKAVSKGGPETSLLLLLLLPLCQVPHPTRSLTPAPGADALAVRGGGQLQLLRPGEFSQLSITCAMDKTTWTLNSQKLFFLESPTCDIYSVILGNDIAPRDPINGSCLTDPKNVKYFILL